MAHQFSRKEFEERIYRFLVNEHQRFHLFKNETKDDFIDYLNWLYPRMKRAIDAYKEVGSSFDAYIGSLVHWSFKEYWSRAAKRRVIEYAYWETIAVEELEAGEYIPTYLLDESFQRVKNPQQILILVLKAYAFLSDAFIARVLPALDVTPDCLAGMLDKLRNMRGKQDDKVRKLQEKLHYQYYRCLVYLRQIASLPEELEWRKKTLQASLERAQKRYTAIKQQLASSNRMASNSQVAEIMGIPKGTVDSTLYLMKKKALLGLYPQQ